MLNQDGIYHLHPIQENEKQDPFIFDIMTSCFELFYSASNNTALFDELIVNWTSNSSQNHFIYGQIQSSFYTKVGNISNIFVLGKENDDTDEYDISILVHEWIHYFENTLSRADSLGGSHTYDDVLDSRLSFGEGLATGISGIISGRYYIDTMGAQQSNGYFDDLESGNIPDDGWCNEYCLAQLIYDICDDGEDNETISLSIQSIYSVLTSDNYKNSYAFTNIYLFVTQLKQFLSSQNDNESISKLNLLCERYSIIVNDEWGTNETKTYATNRNLLLFFKNIK